MREPDWISIGIGVTFICLAIGGVIKVSKPETAPTNPQAQIDSLTAVRDSLKTEVDDLRRKSDILKAWMHENHLNVIDEQMLKTP